jgi:hypothetical protein
MVTAINGAAAHIAGSQSANQLGEWRSMNGLDEFLTAAMGLFFGITVLMFVLTYLERSLYEPARDSERLLTGRQPAGGNAAGKMSGR